MTRHILPVGAALLLASCSSLPVPGRPATGAPTETARQIMKQSAASHGDAWRKYRKVEVEYTGEWSAIAKRLQPVLTDSGFRGSSVETYQPASGEVRQVHTGPLGTKTVDRQRPEIHVSFNGTASSDREVLDSAALVADAYTAFLFGPSWLSRKGTDFKLIGERTLDGELCHLIEGRLSPGFGNSPEDHFIVWISRDSSLMRRFQFTLNGMDSTRGADVDVTFSDYQKASDGSVWPRNFLEYIQRPLRAKAHQWRMESLKLDGAHAMKPGDIHKNDRLQIAFKDILLRDGRGINSHPGRKLFRHQGPVTEPPAVRYKRTVADRMEHAAFAGVGINPRPQTLNDEQVVPLHVVDDAAFDVGDAFGDERGLDRFGLHRRQAELVEFIGVGTRAGSNAHNRFRHVGGGNGDDAFPGFQQCAIRMVSCARDERQFRREVHHHGA